MPGKKFASLFTPDGLPNLAILIVTLVLLGTNFTHHSWTRTNPKNRGVIKWDVISYYSYLPATFIYGDLKLDFIGDPGFKNDNKIWYSKLDNGNRLIITSMGLSFLYAPFFLIAHLLATIFELGNDGYSSIYQFFLVFSALFYVFWGLIFLKKILLRVFSPKVVAITLVLIVLGTNLLYYATIEAAMAHSYNFFLVILFLWQVIRWYRDPGWKNAIFTGLLLGFLSLVRPTNILMFFILLLWGVGSFKGFRERILFFLKRSHLVLLMLVSFILVWIPQFVYWKVITGHFLFFSYGVEGGAFYFLHPQIIDSLFSYRKGWFIYTPLMLFAVFGIYLLRKKYKLSFIPILVLLITTIYVQSSWWSWWFGGGFGLRAYIDIYGILAIPLAAVVDFSLQQKIKWRRTAMIALFSIIMMSQWIQTYQYRHNIIHYAGMNKHVFWKRFMKFERAADYWQTLTMPDYKLARDGIYVEYLTGADNSYLTEVAEERALQIIIEEIKENKKVFKQVSRYAIRSDKSLETALEEIADRMYYRKTNK